MPGRQPAGPRRALLLAAVLSLPLSTAWGQGAPLGVERRQSPTLAPPELPPPGPAPTPRFELPPVPPPPPPAAPGGDAVRRGETVFVREVRFAGNTKIATAELQEVARSYEGREVSIEEILALRERLTRLYVETGYVNSGAVLAKPAYDPATGVLSFRVVEGRLTEVAIAGLHQLRPGYLERRIRLGAGPPVNVEELQERLGLLLLDPSIERLQARFGPGARPGEGRLEVDVIERPRFALDAEFANDRSPTVGGEYLGLTATARNVLGFSDPFRLHGEFAEGLVEADASYSVPLTARDLRLFVFGQTDESDLVEEPFDELDIESRTRTLSVGLSRPLLATPENQVRLAFSLDRRRSETFLDGERFAFSEGTNDGRSDVTALRFAQEWERRGRAVALATRSTFSQGIDALGATVNDDGPDSRFFAWLGQFELAGRLTDGGQQLVARGLVQLAAHELLPIEQVAIGGADTVRGYRENELVRDNGYALSLEYQIPVLRAPVPRLSLAPDDGTVYLAPFVDYGGGFNTDRETPEPDRIASVGTGLLWSPSPRFGLELYWGVPLVDVDEPDDKDLQDWGVHFRLRTGFDWPRPRVTASSR